MTKITAWIKARWAEVSTKLGLLVAAASTVLPNFAQYDRRIAYFGAAAGVLMVLWNEK